MNDLEEELEQLTDEFMARNPNEYTVDENWSFFKSRLKQATNNHVPQKRVKSSRRLPRITTTIRRMMRKRARLFKKARTRRSKRAIHWQIYKKHRNAVKKQIDLAHSRYVNEVISGSLEEGDGKAFWNYIKLNRTDTIGVPPLKVENKVVDSNQDKANILNKHFQSVFANEDTANVSNKGLSPFPEIGDIVFSTAKQSSRT